MLVSVHRPTFSSLFINPLQPSQENGHHRSINKRRPTSMSLMDSSSKNGNSGLSGDQRLYLGMDFGTSGARFALIDKHGTILSEAKRGYPKYMSAGRQGYARKSEETIDWTRSWKTTLFLLLEDVPVNLRPFIASISIDGTSATTIILDRWMP
ncbi:hypothetical protein Ddye_003987 [Dipteronia dyeriana]|uniref:Carbohydrate kinase FGGY N-terminal domain-containing protein n=1 Tax=Dipteronia dyeriana TaxID=168575 RepID=A0AAE0CWI7_9ROSI|nr:hypothetical protein Ddye_003987 [Dipteronia dyeriana]